MSKFRQFMRRKQRAYNYLNARLYAYSAAEILIEGTRRAGKRITRKKLVAAIEELDAFDAGLNKPARFSSQRSVGLQGAYIARLDQGQFCGAPVYVKFPGGIIALYSEMIIHLRQVIIHLRKAENIAKQTTEDN